MDYEMRLEPDGCPCPVWGCPNRTRCEDCMKSHMTKGHLNACGFYTMLPVYEELIASVEDEKIRTSLDEKLMVNAKAYSLCRSMQTDMPLDKVLEFLKSKVDGFRCNAHESLKKRTGLDIEFDPGGEPVELEEGLLRWREALEKWGLSLSRL